MGDYALLLAIELRRSYNIHTKFILSDTTWKGLSVIEGFQVEQIGELSAKCFVDLLNKETKTNVPILLQYVGYGYEKRGCPFWLVQGLEAWKRQKTVRLLSIMFHEIAAKGRFPSSSFFNAPIQLWLAGRLARIADNIRTSLFVYMKTIEKISHKPAESIIVQPVFSNVGELTSPVSFLDRNPYAAIFGSKLMIDEIFSKHTKTLDETCRRLKIEKLFILGAKISNVGRHPYKIEQFGILPAEDISDLLRKCRFGVATYIDGRLAKSGIFAAYCAHHIVPLLLTPNNSEQDGLLQGSHYLLCENESKTMSVIEAEKIADNASQWYQSHNLSLTARSIVQSLDLYHL